MFEVIWVVNFALIFSFLFIHFGAGSYLPTYIIIWTSDRGCVEMFCKLNILLEPDNICLLIWTEAFNSHFTVFLLKWRFLVPLLKVPKYIWFFFWTNPVLSSLNLLGKTSILSFFFFFSLANDLYCYWILIHSN